MSLVTTECPDPRHRTWPMGQDTSLSKTLPWATVRKVNEQISSAERIQLCLLATPTWNMAPLPLQRPHSIFWPLMQVREQHLKQMNPIPTKLATNYNMPFKRLWRKRWAKLCMHNQWSGMCWQRLKTENRRRHGVADPSPSRPEPKLSQAWAEPERRWSCETEGGHSGGITRSLLNPKRRHWLLAKFLAWILKKFKVKDLSSKKSLT